MCRIACTQFAHHAEQHQRQRRFDNRQDREPGEFPTSTLLLMLVIGLFSMVGSAFVQPEEPQFMFTRYKCACCLAAVLL